MAGNILRVEGQLLSTVNSSVSTESAQIVHLINLYDLHHATELQMLVFIPFVSNYFHRPEIVQSPQNVVRRL